MRRAAPIVVLAGCLVAGVLPAFAADGSVSIHDDAYLPADVAVMPGETVTWSASGGSTAHPHSVHFDTDADPLAPASTGYDASRRFDAAGEYRYHCDIHPLSMHGTVYVNASGTVPAPSPSPSPTPTASPAPTSSPAPPAPAVAAVSSFRVRAARGRFCTRRTAACRRPGVFLLVDLGASGPVRVRGTLRRGSRRVRAVSLRVRPGSRRVRLPGARLKAGRYTLTLRAGDITRRVRFRVRAG